MVEGKYSYQTGKVNSFTVVDYVLFGLMLLGSAGIGAYYAIVDRKKSNTKDFLLAGGNMNPIPVALSLLASFMSAITLLGTPAEMYNYTTIYFYIGLSYLFVIAASSHLFVPIFYNLRVTSVYEYLEKRFSRGVRTLGSLTFCIQMILYMSIVLYAPSLALNKVTGFNLWGSVISVGVVCTFYTTLGGMKAVLWTDVFQVAIMMIGLLATLIEGCIRAGGFNNAWEHAWESGRIVFDDFNPDPAVRHTFWSLVIGGYFTWLAVYGVNQAQVQRACTCPTLKKAQLALWLNFPGLCMILYICCLIGIVLYDFYRTCDPKTFGLVEQADQLLPLYVMDILGFLKGLPGLFIACLFSGALSTISSGLNSLSTVILEDVIRTYISNDMSEKKATWISKILVIVLGFVCLGLAYVASLLGGVLQAALSLFGMIGGPLLGVFTLGLFFPWANKWGAYTGLIASLIFMFWIGIGAQTFKFPSPKSMIDISGCNWNVTQPPPTVNGTILTTTVATTVAAATTAMAPVKVLYTLSYLWYSATGVLTAVVVGLLVSFATGYTKAKDINPKLMVPFFDIVFPCLPEKIRKPLRFGVNYSERHGVSSGRPRLKVSTISGNHVSNNPMGIATPRTGILKTPSQSTSSVDSGRESSKTTSFSDDVSVVTIASRKKELADEIKVTSEMENGKDKMKIGQDNVGFQNDNQTQCYTVPPPEGLENIPQIIAITHM